MSALHAEDLGSNPSAGIYRLFLVFFRDFFFLDLFLEDFFFLGVFFFLEVLFFRERFFLLDA